MPQRIPFPHVSAPDFEDRCPWLVQWEELLPILRGVTSLEDTDGKQRGICPGNISTESVNMALVVLAARGLNQFARQAGGGMGMYGFLELVAGNDSRPPLWEDPCLPQEIAPLLFKEGIGILIPEELLAACAAMRRSLPDASHAAVTD